MIQKNKSSFLELTYPTSKQTDWLSSIRSAHMIGVLEHNIFDWLRDKIRLGLTSGKSWVCLICVCDPENKAILLGGGG